MDGWETVFTRLKSMFRAGKFYLCIIPLCIFSPLVFLALNTQGRLANCLAFGIRLWHFPAISTRYATMDVSLRLGCVYLSTYPSRMMRRLLCWTEFWYFVVLVRRMM